jgi:ferritin-like metal-binding protein YciE
VATVGRLALVSNRTQGAPRARQLGRNDCASVLQRTLEEGKATDQKLTTLAEGKVNLRAAR